MYIVNYLCGQFFFYFKINRFRSVRFIRKLYRVQEYHDRRATQHMVFTQFQCLSVQKKKFLTTLLHFVFQSKTI